MIDHEVAPVHWLHDPAFRAYAMQRLGTPAGDGLGDGELNPGFRQEGMGTERRCPAAVLVPIISRSPLSVLFTVRTPGLASHAGQIAFPGGKVEPGDATPVAAAVREAHEEIGLEPHCVDVLGELDRYPTGTGYLITPVIALVDPAFTLTVDTNEVADVFEVPLAFLMDAASYRREARVLAGRERHFYAVPFADRYIWGITAGILRQLQLRLASS